MPATPDPGLRWLYQFVWPHRRRILALLGLSVLTTSIVLIQPYLTKLLIDDGLLAGDFEALLKFAGLLFGAGLIATLLSGANRYYYTRLSGTILFGIRETVYRHLQTLSPAFFSRNRTGDILARLDGDVAEVQRFAVDSLFAAVSAVLGLVGSLAFMLLLSWQLTLLALVMVPLQWLYLRTMRQRVQQQTRKMRERASDLSSFLVETVPAMKFIQGASAEEREAKRLGGLNRNYLDDLLKLQLVEFATSAVPSTMTTATRAVAFIIGGYWVIEGSLALGSLIAFGSYLGMATGPVQALLGLYMATNRVKVSLQRVSYLTGAKADVVSAGTRSPDQSLRGEITFEQVNFAYPESGEAILEDASVTLPAGRKVCLQSPSGTGKTTLVDLLMRYYDPDEGRILVDGVDLREFNLGEWRRRIALVAQDVVLFRGSMLDNIRYARPDATDAEVEAAVSKAQLDSLVERLPQGLATPVGERGTRLSGGERQRIAIARALLQQPLLVIFDEATSAVDLAAEQALLTEFDALFADRTRLLISHRPAPEGDADFMLTIDNGRLQFQPGETQ